MMAFELFDTLTPIGGFAITSISCSSASARGNAIPQKRVIVHYQMRIFAHPG